MVINKDTYQEYRGLKDKIMSKDSVISIENQCNSVLTSYVSKHCLHPRLIHYHDKVTNELKHMYVNCGKCHHCRYMHQQEWVSRMILHTKTYKYAYFVTLTYASYGSLKHIPSCLLDAYFRLDNINENHRMCYSPCLLRLEHLQRFLKYLRKYHDAPISFFSGSEYGKTYGRPHHHLILWTDSPLSRSVVDRAWSARIPHLSPLAKKHLLAKGLSLSRLIGRVDFNDLNGNGTIVADGINFGNDAKKCFAYVAKYLCKQFVDDTSLAKSSARLKYFVRDFGKLHLGDPHQPFVSYDIINKILNPRIRSHKEIIKSWTEHLARILKINEHFENKRDSNSSYLPTYVKTLSEVKQNENEDYLYRNLESSLSSQELFNALVSWYPTINRCVLGKIFAPFCNFSRGNGIGERYLLENLDRFKTANFAISQADGTAIVSPRYFFRKTKDALFRFTLQKQSIIDKKLSPSKPCINTSIFRDIMAQMDELATMYRSHMSFVPQIYCKSPEIAQLVRSPYAIVDKLNNTRLLLVFDDKLRLRFDIYKYDKSKRLYVLITSMSLKSFVMYLCASRDAYNRFCHLLPAQDFDVQRQFFDDLELYTNTFFGSALYESLIDKQTEYLALITQRSNYSDSIHQRNYIE